MRIIYNFENPYSAFVAYQDKRFIWIDDTSQYLGLAYSSLKPNVET